MPLDFPRIETAKSWITMGMDQDLNKAWAQAKGQTVKFLSEQRSVPAAQAEALMPSVSDCRVSQVVNVKKGIHCLSPKNTATRRTWSARPRRRRPITSPMRSDADLNKAMDQASMGMIKLLETEKKIARLDAYGLASVAMDCRVGAISDTEKNVHCVMPKSILVAGARANYSDRLMRGGEPIGAVILRSVRRTRLEGWPRTLRPVAVLRDARFAGSSGRGRKGLRR